MLGGRRLDDATWNRMASCGPVGGQLHGYHNSGLNSEVNGHTSSRKRLLD